MSERLWCFELILLPSRDIERSYVQVEAVSRDLAKTMFGERYERTDYPSPLSPYTPDMIRFLDKNGTELLRYTAEEYLKAKAT